MAVAPSEAETAGAAMRRVAARLAAAGIETARFEARALLAGVLTMEPAQVFARADRLLSADETERLEAWTQRREAREPLSHIVGRRGFWTLDLAVTADTLDPRPDSETVIEAVLAERPDRERPTRILDFGTGTGCLLLALLAEYPAGWGVGVDLGAGAVAVARGNAAANGLGARASFVRGRWGAGVAGRFDVIVSNPPYIPDGEIDALEPEVARWEPRLALAGGADGLACYRALADDLVRLLAPGGVTVLEVGAGQAADVSAILAGAGLDPCAVRRDLGGVARCVVARPCRVPHADEA